MVPISYSLPLMSFSTLHSLLIKNNVNLRNHEAEVTATRDVRRRAAIQVGYVGASNSEWPMQ